ncbi:MAG: hypothetical protein KAJ44_01670 [Thermoplasmatales archaeon]|nr:hypothetical protein [Thermoplasmatales archaeon]
MNETLTETIKNIPVSKKSEKLWIVLLKDLGNFALYFNKSDNCFSGFEVHKICIREAREHDIKLKDGSIKHLSLPKRRVIASNEGFGRYAWRYPTLDLVYEKYPKFKEYRHEIKSKLNDALITVKECVLREGSDKTLKVGSKPPVLKPKSDVIARKGESIILCQNCNSRNRIVRGFFWSGRNKGKMKPLSDMLCPECGHLMGHNVVDGVKNVKQ